MEMIWIAVIALFPVSLIAARAMAPRPVRAEATARKARR